MAGLLKLGYLPKLSPGRYLAPFRAFISPVETRGKDSLQLLYGSKVPDSTLCEPGADLRVLGIGSGSGDVDSIMLKKLLQRHSSVYNRVVEPSGEMLARYKALVREDTSLGAVKFDWRQQTAEEYFQTKEDTKFHLVHAVHALFDVEEHDATLRKMWEQLSDGGYMFVAMQSDKGDCPRLRSKLWEEFGQGDRLKTSLRTSGDVKQYLDTAGISYVASEDEISVNVTECFRDDSETGKLVLEFLTQTPNVSSEPEIKSMALEYIRSNSSLVDGKIYFKAINEVILAVKDCAKE
ncbi:histamine N-methyltransferase B-like [Branchiostoma lanceolatum]|uniref:histamine N-methyltransferase B-like n=1 Tax=Branchiostoma lanceolatum TaxID=7740 RepID=UPI00345183DD